MVGKKIKLLFTDRELVFSTLVSLPKPGFADIVGDVEVVQTMAATRLFEKGSHPSPCADGVCREIQRYR